MSVWIAHHRKVSHNTAYIHRRLNQNILLARQLSNPINFFPAVALKAEVIEPGLHFILHDDQDEYWIFSRGSCGTEPDIVTTFEPPITDNPKTTEGRIELDRRIDIGSIDRDVSPARRHLLSALKRKPGLKQR